MKDRSKRIQEIDIIKGYGMLLIALYHLVFRPMNSIPDKMIRSLGWAMIAVYFMFSGYISKPEKGILACYRRRTLGLILPIFFGELVLLFLGGMYCRATHDYSARDILHDAAVTFLRPEITSQISSEWGEGGVLFIHLSPVWFIWAMGFTELLYYPLAKLLAKRSLKIWVPAILGLMAIQIPLYICLEPYSWCLTVIPIYAVFMLIGLKLKELDVIEKLRNVPVLPTVIYTILFFAAHFGLFVFGGNESYYVSAFGTRGWMDVPLVVLQLLVAFPALFGVARLIAAFPHAAKRFRWLGQHTVTILLWHCLFGLIFSDLLDNYTKLGKYWYLENHGIELTPEIFWKSVLIFVLSILCSIPIAAFGDFMVVHIFEKRLRKKPEEEKKDEKNPDA